MRARLCVRCGDWTAALIVTAFLIAIGLGFDPFPRRAALSPIPDFTSAPACSPAPGLFLSSR